MTIFDWLQLIGGIILAVGYIPQIIRIKTTHSCEDLSVKTYFSLFIGIGFMEIYAFNLCSEGSGRMFLITNSVSLVIVLYICLLLLIERENAEAMIQDAFFVSRWQNGNVFVTPCVVNLKTKEISEIVPCPYDENGTLDTECLLLFGKEYPVCESEENADNEQFWY